MADQGSETWLRLLCFEPRNSETRCGHHIAAVEGELSRFEFQTNAFRNSFDAISGSMSHDDQKFFASKPSAQIAASRVGLQNVGEFFQNFIAGIVPKGVVDVFKAVQIGDDHPNGKAVPGGAAQFTGGPLIDCPTIRQSGHGIG